MFSLVVIRTEFDWTAYILNIIIHINNKSQIRGRCSIIANNNNNNDQLVEDHNNKNDDDDGTSIGNNNGQLGY